MKSLKTTRQELGYSQADMAKYLQVTKSTISMVESGKRELPRNAQEKFAYLMMEHQGFDSKGKKLSPTPAAEAEIESHQIIQNEIAQEGLSKYAIACSNTTRSLQKQLETAEFHYSKAMDILTSVAQKRHAQIPPDKLQTSWLNGREAKAKIKLSRFPLHSQIILKIKLAVAEIEQQYVNEELSKFS